MKRFFESAEILSFYNMPSFTKNEISNLSCNRESCNSKKESKFENLPLDDDVNSFGLNSFPYLYFRRWIVLLFFSIIFFLNYFNLIQYHELKNFASSLNGTITPKNTVEEYVNTNWLFLSHMIVNILFTFPAMFLLELKGLKVTCLIGIFLTAVSSWIKFASILSEYFSVLFIAQIVCSIGHTFIQSCLVKLSALWFGWKEIAIAISVLNLNLNFFSEKYMTSKQLTSV